LAGAGVFYNFFDPYLFPPPLRFAEGQQGGIGDDIPPCLRRNLTFLPSPCQVFMEYSINELGDDPIFFNKIKKTER
jgi:hypothetical protein